ncbi:hypothetical protein VST7929_01012 [Vibrio stylophorae]|uniref:N-acetyltransferase domain-containing protein n=1 Tax=Vibrio stylophorae TaxID=659351 RepID=A0ABM8ZS77_9VIBR|nr:GNAT family N-acetyltransferase [Vibrio stylophorae]CAH0533151.1 hypothetical protein VST7929_01012 [Vibrio stylophorae]
MQIERASQADAASIQMLVEQVSTQSILPDLTLQGRSAYLRFMQEEMASIFEDARYLIVKMSQGQDLMGFAALRDGHYLSHLFVALSWQRRGVGRQLLNALCAHARSNQISLRSSINALGFYQSLGFQKTGPEATYQGIRYVPMRLQLRR